MVTTLTAEILEDPDKAIETFKRFLPVAEHAETKKYVNEASLVDLLDSVQFNFCNHPFSTEDSLNMFRFVVEMRKQRLLDNWWLSYRWCGESFQLNRGLLRATMEPVGREKIGKHHWSMVSDSSRFYRSANKKEASLIFKLFDILSEQFEEESDIVYILDAFYMRHFEQFADLGVQEEKIRKAYAELSKRKPVSAELAMMFLQVNSKISRVNGINMSDEIALKERYRIRLEGAKRLNKFLNDQSVSLMMRALLAREFNQLSVGFHPSFSRPYRYDLTFDFWDGSIRNEAGKLIFDGILSVAEELIESDEVRQPIGWMCLANHLSTIRISRLGGARFYDPETMERLANLFQKVIDYLPSVEGRIARVSIINCLSGACADMGLDDKLIQLYQMPELFDTGSKTIVPTAQICHMSHLGLRDEFLDLFSRPGIEFDSDSEIIDGRNLDKIAELIREIKDPERRQQLRTAIFDSELTVESLLKGCDAYTKANWYLRESFADDEIDMRTRQCLIVNALFHETLLIAFEEDIRSLNIKQNALVDCINQRPIELSEIGPVISMLCLRSLGDDLPEVANELNSVIDRIGAGKYNQWELAKAELYLRLYSYYFTRRAFGVIVLGDREEALKMKPLIRVHLKLAALQFVKKVDDHAFYESGAMSFALIGLLGEDDLQETWSDGLDREGLDRLKKNSFEQHRSVVALRVALERCGGDTVDSVEFFEMYKSLVQMDEVRNALGYFDSSFNMYLHQTCLTTDQLVDLHEHALAYEKDPILKARLAFRAGMYQNMTGQHERVINSCEIILSEIDQLKEKRMLRILNSGYFRKLDALKALGRLEEMKKFAKTVDPESLDEEQIKRLKQYE